MAPKRNVIKTERAWTLPARKPMKALPRLVCTTIALGALGCVGFGCTTDGSGVDLEGHAAQAAKCGNSPLEETVPVRPSSFRSCPNGDDGVGICDPEEVCDHTHFDRLCAPDPCAPSVQDGDLRCHRICNDGSCAAGETCVERPVYVSDTPTQFRSMCLCEGDDCPERVTKAEGGLEAWVPLEDMPTNLFFHSAASNETLIFVSGGLSLFEQDGTFFNSEEALVHGAHLTTDGSISDWFTAGALPVPLTQHASVVANGRLYILGGEQDIGRSLASAVYSARILANGSLGPWRSETPFPMPRSFHVALVDGARLIVVGGRFDRLSSGTETDEAWVTSIGDDGELSEWTSVPVPQNPYYNGATIAAGRLYVVGDTRDEYPDIAATLFSAELRQDIGKWEFRPEAAPEGDNRAYTLSAHREARLFGLCDALVALLPGIKAMAAGLDSAGSVGAWRVASGVQEDRGSAVRLSNSPHQFAVTASPNGYLYVLGGIERTSVWRSRRQR